MKQVVIENPVVNSPFVEPQRHFKFTDEGIDQVGNANFIERLRFAEFKLDMAAFNVLFVELRLDPVGKMGVVGLKAEQIDRSTSNSTVSPCSP